MFGSSDSYLRATRHPRSCLIFLLPLLAVYEGGVIWLGGRQPETVRSGADSWVRWSFESIGIDPLYLPPLVIVAFFAVWCAIRRGDRPNQTLSVWVGMTLESVLFAFILWSCDHASWSAIAEGTLPLAASGEPTEALAQTVSYVGAGIYEEILFRLLLLQLLFRIILMTETSRFAAAGFAMLLSSLAFAAAHHVGGNGEAFVPEVFAFRAMAGIYFALLCQLRGFGVAAGTHAFYDVLVGVALVQ